MGLFDRFKKKELVPGQDYDQWSALGDDPDAWDGLGNEKLQYLVMLKCVEYGVSQDAGRVPFLLALYRHAMEHLDVSERIQMLNQFRAMTEERKGQGHMGLMMYLAADDAPAIRSTAAMGLSLLYDPEDGGELAGPEFVVNCLLNQGGEPEQVGTALGGVLLLGDQRLLPLLLGAWSQLSEEARLGMTFPKSGFIYEGVIEFWLRCMETDCSESVLGSVVAAIAKMPVIAQVPFVQDIYRVLPVYADSQNPIRIIHETSFGDYLEEIRPRLEALEAVEEEPKLIPKIYEIWENPEQFRGLIG